MIGPLYFVTGLPGNGKTLYTICTVKALSEKENRPVFYSGIEILDKEALPWTEFDAHEWYKLPVGAIIVIDEAHKVFPVRPASSKVPDYVTPIGELRHSGYDMFIITQDGMEVDSAVRRRCTTHLHAVRRLGFEACHVREWARFISNAANTDKGTVDKHEFVYPKQAYNWYLSAEKHTIKKSIPLKVYFLFVVPFVLAFAVWYVYSIFTKQRGPDPAAQPVHSVSGTVGSQSANAGPSGAAPMTTGAYLASYSPRVSGLAFTAPVYDSATKPVRVPYPAACVANDDRCKCYTQQATKLDMPEAMCRQIAADGFFVAWDERRAVDAQVSRVAPVSAPAPDMQPGSGLGGFNTTRFASAEPVSTVKPPESQQQGQKGRASAP